MELEINYKKKKKEKTNVEAKQHATKQPMVQQRNKGEIKKKYLGTNENGNTTFQNLWDPAKAVLGGNFPV